MNAPDDRFLRSSPSPTPFVARILAWWSRRGSAVLSWAAVLMALAALVWLSYETWRLLWQPSPEGAIDLRLRLT
jgi:hypothetical protein